MPVSKAQQKATAKYEAKVYDKTLIRLPKGHLDKIKAYTEQRGQSVNNFINQAIERAMVQDGAPAAPGMPAGAGAVSLPPDTIKAAQRAAEAAGEAVPEFVARAVETQAERDALSRRMKGTD